jgi:hypothetical protein
VQGPTLAALLAGPAPAAQAPATDADAPISVELPDDAADPSPESSA